MSKIKKISERMHRNKKYLLMREGIYNTNFYWSKRLNRQDLAGQRCRISLKTGDERVAVAFVDRCIIPIQRWDDELDVLEGMIMSFVKGKEKLEEELLKKLPEFRYKIDTSTLTLGCLTGKYKDYLKNISGLSSGTVIKYNGILDSFCLLMGDDCNPIEIEGAHVDKYVEDCLKLPVQWQTMFADKLKILKDRGMVINELKSLEKSRRVSKNTMFRHLILLNAFFAHAMKKGWLPSFFINPVKASIGDLKETAPKFKHKPTQEELEKLHSMPYPNSKHVDKLAWKCIPEIARYSGLRVGEICLLEAEDIVYQDGIRCISVNNRETKKTKNIQSIRLVPISDKLSPCIDEILRHKPAGRIFTKCGDYGDRAGAYFDKIFNRYVKKYASPYISFHCLRMYVSDEMVSNNINQIDCDRILGQTGEETQRSYIATDLPRFKKYLDTVR